LWYLTCLLQWFLLMIPACFAHGAMAVYSVMLQNQLFSLANARIREVRLPQVQSFVHASGVLQSGRNLSRWRMFKFHETTVQVDIAAIYMKAYYDSTGCKQALCIAVLLLFYCVTWSSSCDILKEHQVALETRTAVP
jgi:hypothetical protein